MKYRIWIPGYEYPVAVRNVKDAKALLNRMIEKGHISLSTKSIALSSFQVRHNSLSVMCEKAYK